MLAKFDGRCACGNRFLAGTEITYDRTTRKVTACASCKSTKLAEALERAEESAETATLDLSGDSLDSILPETALMNYRALVDRLDAAQSTVAAWTPADGNLRVVAAAGSGKTTTSVALIATLIRSEIVPAGRIVATTFTSKAGKELVDRLLQVLPPGAISESPNGSKDQMRAGTFHSIALRALRHAEPNVWRLGKCIDLPEKSRDKGIPSAAILWNRVLGWGEIPGLPADVKGLDLEEPDVKAYQLAADVCRATGASGDELDKLIATAELEQGLRGLARAWRLVCRSKQALGAFDFADALQAYYDGLKLGTQPIRDSADVVLVDEAQDNSKVQLEIAKLLSKNGRLILVGDVRQCQPAGTQVLTPKGLVGIETLKDGDEVCGWSRSDKYVQRGGNGGHGAGSKVKVAVRPYTGLLTRVEAGSEATETTDSHRWLVRWDDAARDLYAVYLMRKSMPSVGACYRIGWCKVLDESKGAKMAHYKVRARIEGADAIWFLKVTRDRAEASAWESIYATRYGIPTVMFNAPENATLYTQKNLNLIWRELGAQSLRNVAQVFEDFDLSVLHPLWTADGEVEVLGTRGSRRTLFECVAANLCVGMAVPVWDGKRGYDWKPIYVSRRRVHELPVYSLDVETHHAYVADGLCTLNSIYSWRGAYPDMFLRANEEIGAKTLELPTNYRSVESVVEIGNNIARGKGWALGAEAKAHRAEPGVVEVKPYTDPAEEAEQTARIIQAALDEGAELSDFAILTRTNALAGAYEAALVARKIPCVVVGGQPFFDRKEVKDALAYYRLSAHDDIDALARICNKPRRFLGKAFVAAVRSRMDDRSMLDAIAQVAPTLRGASRDGAEELVATLHTLRNMEWPAVPKTIASLLAAPDAETKAGEADSDRSGIPLALAAIAQDFPSAEALCAFAVRCATEVKGVSEETMAIEGRVTISTVHKAKGLEWKHVFVSCTKGVFPHARASNLDEELRLFYVACTRAKDHLTLSACGLDLRGKDAGPSSFLAYAPQPAGPKGPGGGAPPPAPLLGEEDEDEPHYDDVEEIPIQRLEIPERPEVKQLLDELQQYDDAFVHGAPSIGDCTRCEGTDGPGTGNPLPCDMHPKQLGVELAKRLEHAREYAKARTDREARAVAGPGGRYVPATREDFEELLRPIGFISAASDVVRKAHEHVLELGLPDKAKKGYIALRVYTSVALGEADARELGEDAIRVSALFVADDGATVPLRKKMQRVFRTRSWRLNLLERIETVLAGVEKAPACPRCGAPMAERTAKKGEQETKFWGCVLFKTNTAYACKGTRPFEEE